VAILRRAYRLLTERADFPPEDIVLDPAVLAVATGLEEHRGYAVAFIESVRLLKAACPGALISGGISNLSFAFRGNDLVREAMHAAFLYHAIAAGLDLGIVNAGQLAVYEEIPRDLRDRVEDVLFNRRPDAPERLIEFAAAARGPVARKVVDAAWRAAPVEERLRHALVHGVLDHLEDDLAEARARYPQALDIIEGPLMDGMRHVGELFGAGMMFLPQVVKSARVMRHAVGLLEPELRAGEAATARPRAGGTAASGPRARGRMVLATVRGDVHDIGKNIVRVMLGCGGYEVIDLGVMVPADRILAAAREQAADAIGLSGLITPSLEEMTHVAAEMERQGFHCPLLIGGATTSRQHTAVRIAPAYSGEVVHVRDASLASTALAALLDPQRRAAYVAENRALQEELRRRHAEARERPLVPFAAAAAHKLSLDWRQADLPVPAFSGRRVVAAVPLGTLAEWIDWTFFFRAWDLRGRYPEILDHPEHGPAARGLYKDARILLDEITARGALTAAGVYGFWPAAGDGEDIVLYSDERREGELLRFHMLRQQERKAVGEAHLCLADFVAPRESGRADHVGGFAVTAGIGARELAARYERDRDDYRAIMVKALADRLAEALAEQLHQAARREWGYGREEKLTKGELLAGRYRGSRPAFGYPACPDHSEKFTLFELLAAPAVGITLTERAAMEPAASVAGLYLSHPESRYFNLGRIGRDQVRAYAERKRVTEREVERWLAPYLDYDPQ
jgi:5-methyltetrahydrofolate--homocysteine methyltransferase